MADREQEEMIKSGQRIKGKGGGWWKGLHAHVQTSMILIVGNSQNLDTYHVSMLWAEPILLGYFHSPVLPGFFSQDGIEVHLIFLRFYQQVFLVDQERKLECDTHPHYQMLETAVTVIYLPVASLCISQPVL